MHTEPADLRGAVLPEPRVPVSHRRAVMICLALLLEGMSSSSITVQVGAIQSDFAVPAVLLSFLAGAFLIANAGLLPAAGRLGDTVDTRKVFLVGVGVFGLGCLLCAVAPIAWFLVAGRAIQGVGAALSAPAAMALITQGQGERRREKAIAVYAAMGAVGFSLGLVLPGFVVSLLGWRMSFAIMIPVVVMIMVITRGVPRRPPRPGTRPDLVGTLVVTATLMVALHLVGGAATVTPVLLVVEAVVVIAGIALLVRRGGIIGFPRHVATSPRVLGAGLVLAAVFAGAVPSMYVLSLALQNIAGHSAFTVGLIILPQPLVFGLLARPGARLVRALGSDGSLVVGGAVLVISLVALGAVWGLGGAWWLIMVTMAGVGASLALTFPAASIAAISAAPEPDRGSVAGLLTAFQNIGGALGLALMALAGLVPDQSWSHAVTGVFGVVVAMALAAAMVLVGGAVGLICRLRHSQTPADAAAADRR